MNLTRVNDSPEVYRMTESRTVRVSKRWNSSGTKSGECVSIFPDGTTIPFVPTRKTRDHVNRKRTANLQNVQRKHLLEIATTKGLVDALTE